MLTKSKIIIGLSLLIIVNQVLIPINNALAAEPNFSHKVVVQGLNHPWAVVFLSDDKILISERNGDLVLFKQGKKIVLDLPVIDVFAQGQGGLLDLSLHPNYKNNGWIYLTYSRYDDDLGASTALVRFKIKQNKLSNWQLLYVANAHQHTAHHFGSRIAFDDDGYVYVSVGDRGKRHQAQNNKNDIGSILRLHDDGRIPDDNPFNNAVHSYGHRNPQGLIYHNGELISHEHGPRGGDELNIIKKGVNYGWPVISYGREYTSNATIGQTHKDGMAQPNYYWVPSIAPSGMAVYQTPSKSSTQTTKVKPPNWQNNLLIGSLKFAQLVRLTRMRDKIKNEQRLFTQKFGRIRDVVVRHSHIYLLTDANNGKLIRLSLP